MDISVVLRSGEMMRKFDLDWGPVIKLKLNIRRKSRRRGNNPKKMHKSLRKRRRKIKRVNRGKNIRSIQNSSKLTSKSTSGKCFNKWIDS